MATCHVTITNHFAAELGGDMVEEFTTVWPGQTAKEAADARAARLRNARLDYTRDGDTVTYSPASATVGDVSWANTTVLQFVDDLGPAEQVAGGAS